MKTTHSLPVSSKFLERMRTRVTDVMTKLGRTSAGSVNDVLDLIDHYLDTREVPEIVPGPTAICHIVFFSLKQEIDAAILRSQRARERAALRKHSSFSSQRQDKAILPNDATSRACETFSGTSSPTASTAEAMPSPHPIYSQRSSSTPLHTILLRE